MSITSWLVETAIRLIEVSGYLGIFIGLVLDSCGLPIPSEVILTLSGSLARIGHFNLPLIIILGTFAQLLGAYLAYLIGYFGGQPLVRRYGKYVLLSGHDLDKAEAWFKKHGTRAIIISRIIPIIRTYIGFPAGTFKMSQRKFLVDTLIGSALWSIILTGFGYTLGDKWRRSYELLHLLDYVVIAVLVYFILRFVYKKVIKNRLNA